MPVNGIWVLARNGGPKHRASTSIWADGQEVALIQERNISLLSKTPNFIQTVPKVSIYQTVLRMRQPSSFVRIRRIHFSPICPFTPFTPRFREERIWWKNIRNGPPRFREKNLVRSMIVKSGFFKNMQSMPPWWKPWMKRWAKFSQRLIKQVLPKIPWSFLHRIMVGFPHPRVVPPATYLSVEAKDGFTRVEFANPGLSDTRV